MTGSKAKPSENQNRKQKGGIRRHYTLPSIEFVLSTRRFPPFLQHLLRRHPTFFPAPFYQEIPAPPTRFLQVPFFPPTTSFTCYPFFAMSFANWMRRQRYLNQSPPNADEYPAKPILKPKKVDDIYNVALRSVSSLDLGDVIDAFPETPRSPQQPPSQASQSSQCPPAQVPGELVDGGEAGDMADGRLDYHTQALELHHFSEDQHNTASLDVALCSIEASGSQVEQPSLDTPLPDRKTSEDNALISAAERDCTIVEDVSLLDSTCETHGPESCKIEYEFEMGGQTCHHPSNTESDAPFKTPDEDDGADTNV
ncbi:hypothetical protein SISSUDRAFT_1065933 [Sistotremastrum suecicum HHB10207 ss-3]|uniref:Uncharacterized protein n=1 Tax=Sistotremastrum suecicum HHB10207 ss-3 TaxID=1314776 RepID=A0A165YWZ0_9AGAM|nr:hypothetical protein SISSUDRAFT_1065933 [Sistotremastrum suecicum HHB10207 ss-3]